MSNIRVLIVEDELLIQQSLKILFKKNHCLVDTSTNGKEAIENIKNNDYDLILCDLMLQDISGFDIIDESLYKYSRDVIKRKFVLMSAYRTESILSKVEESECIFISKPFENIHQTLEMLMDFIHENKKTN